MENQCAACKVREWPYGEGSSKPECGFKRGHFSKDWNCATVGMIRELCVEAMSPGHPKIAYVWGGDQKQCLFNLEWAEEIEGSPLALWVTWYKSRGATEQMWLLFEYEPPRAPTEQECLHIAKIFKP